MAQLRDARTSELVAEGTPLELLTIADTLGRRAIVPQPGEELPDDVDLIFDGVGLGFDPATIRDSHASQVDGLEGIVAHDGDLFTDEDKALARRGLEELARRERAAAGAAGDVDEVITSARDADRPTLDPVTLTPPE